MSINSKSALKLMLKEEKEISLFLCKSKNVESSWYLLCVGNQYIKLYTKRAHEPTFTSECKAGKWFVDFKESKGDLNQQHTVTTYHCLVYHETRYSLQNCYWHTCIMVYRSMSRADFPGWMMLYNESIQITMTSF